MSAREHPGQSDAQIVEAARELIAAWDRRVAGEGTPEAHLSAIETLRAVLGGDAVGTYIVTAQRDVRFCPVCGRDHGDEVWTSEVPTLQEARWRCYAVLPAEPGAGTFSELYEAIDALTDVGGIVGPLPDGTMIEVTRA